MSLYVQLCRKCGAGSSVRQRVMLVIMSEVDLEHYRTLLLRQREEITSHTATRAEAGRTVELDQTRTGRLSRMDALQGQAMAQAAQQRAQMQLRRIEAALARLDAGDYGLCAQCEEPIAPRRLEADPAAPLCISCAERG
jgi:DnaK suppressor protein